MRNGFKSQTECHRCDRGGACPMFARGSLLLVVGWYHARSKYAAPDGAAYLKGHDQAAACTSSSRFQLVFFALGRSFMRSIHSSNGVPESISRPSGASGKKSR
jgi:hypothetical protein